MLSKTVQNSSWYRVHSEFLVKIWRIRPDSVARQSVSVLLTVRDETRRTNKLVIKIIIVIVYYLTLYFYDQGEFEFFASSTLRILGPRNLRFFSQGGEPKRSVLLSSSAKDNDHRRGFVKKIKSMHCITTRKKGRE